MDRRSFIAAAAAAITSTTAFAQPRRNRRAVPEPPAELVRLAGRCVLAGWRSETLSPTLAARLSDGALGGVIVARENARGLEQLRTLLARIQALSPQETSPVLVAADQEGGPVSHLSPPLASMPSHTALGAIDDPGLTRRVATAIGQALRHTGVNTDLAPVLDVRTNRANTVVLNRVFGNTPDRVARHGPAFVSGLTDAGVLACAKHFPGHGDTRADSHRTLPIVPHGPERLEQIELVPFRATLDVPMVMLAHVVYQGLDRALPASLSPRAATWLLRERLGFQGVAVTDDLEMSPVRTRWGVSTAAVMAITAGCDLLTVAHSPHLAVSAITALARQAEHNQGFLRRLSQAAARVDVLRARLRTLSPTVQVDSAEILREARARAGRPTQRQRDPTTAR